MSVLILIDLSAVGNCWLPSWNVFSPWFLQNPVLQEFLWFPSLSITFTSFLPQISLETQFHRNSLLITSPGCPTSISYLTCSKQNSLSTPALPPFSPLSAPPAGSAVFQKGTTTPPGFPRLGTWASSFPPFLLPPTQAASKHWQLHPLHVISPLFPCFCPPRPLPQPWATRGRPGFASCSGLPASTLLGPNDKVIWWCSKCLIKHYIYLDTFRHHVKSLTTQPTRPAAAETVWLIPAR